MKKILLTLLIFATLFGANIAYAQNLIQGGTFEDTGDFTNDMSGLEGSSIADIYTDPAIVGYSNVAHTGNRSVELIQPIHRPITFKVNTLQKGKAYKFTAYAKLRDDSEATGVRLFVGTRNTNDKGKKSVGDRDNKIFTLESGKSIPAETETYPYQTGYIYESISPATTLSKTEWTKFERVFYVSNDVLVEEVDENGNITVYIGIKSSAQDKWLYYYLDDVTLEEVEPDMSITDGYSKVYAAKGKDMKYTYKAETYFGYQENIRWSIEGDTADVSINGGTLTVGEKASGTINIIATSTCSITGFTVTSKKQVEIVPFTADDVSVSVNGKPLDGFWVGKDNYVYEYRGETVPTVTATGNQSIIKNENTVFVKDQTKTYDIILKKLPEFSENLFYDGGFEEGVINSSDVVHESKLGGVTIGVTTDPENVRSGRYALKVTPKAKYATALMKATVERGKLYRITMWIKDSSTPGTNNFMTLLYKDRDDLGVEYYSESQKKFIEGYMKIEGNSAFTLNNGWNRIDRLIRITDDAESVELQFGFCLTNSTSEFYVDDVSIYELDMTELGSGAYMTSLYKTTNGEIATTVADADHMEIILYNPENAEVETNLLIAEYKAGRLLNLTKEKIETSDVAKLISKSISVKQETDSISVLAWDTNFAPDTKSVNIK